MAISGRLIADFSSFVDAVHKAEVKLVDMSKGADRVGSALNKMVDNFSGRKLIQDATLMEKAIGGIAGASRLTDTEMRRVNVTMTEAIAKFKALGQAAPVGMQQLAEATKGAGQSTSLLTVGIGKLAGAFTVAKVVQFGADLFQAAGRLQDLHERTDIGVEALQRFKVIAEQSGSSIDQVATAVFQMGKRIAGGDDSAAAAIAELGLDFQKLRNQRPEDTFQEVGSALGQLDDPMKRAQLGAAIFGKSVDDLIPTFKHLNEETGSYLTLSARQVSALDAVGDAFVRLTSSIVPATVASADYVLGISRFIDAIESFKGALPTPQFRTLEADIKASAQAVKDRAAQVLTGTALDAKATEAIKDLDAALSEKNKRLAETKKVAEQVAKANEHFRDSVVNLTSSANGAAQGFGAYGMLLPDLAAHTLLLADRTEVLASALDAASVDVEALQRDGRMLSATLAEMGASIGTLPAVTSQWGEAIEALRLEEAVSGMERWDDEIEELASDLARLAQISGDAFGGIVEDIARLAAAWDLAADAATHYAKAQADGSRTGQGLALLEGATAVASATEGGGARGIIGGAVTGAKLGSAFGPWGTAIGAGVGALVGVARGMGVSEEEKAARVKIGEFNKELQGLATAAQEAEAAMAGWEDAGLAEALIVVRDAYVAAGHSAADAEAIVGRFWDSSHNGGKDTLDLQQQINDVVQEGQQILGERAAAELASVDATRAAAAEKTAALQAELDKLTSQREAVFQRVDKEAAEQHMGVIEKRDRAELKALDTQIDQQRKAMEQAAKDTADAVKGAFKDLEIVIPIRWEVPSLPGGYREAPEAGDATPGFAKGTRGRYLDFGSGTDVRLHGKERIMTEGEQDGHTTIIELDGEVLTRVVSRHQTRQLLSRNKVAAA